MEDLADWLEEKVGTFLAFVISFILLIAFIFGLSLGIAVFIDKWACSSYSRFTERATEYHFPIGCYVEYGDALIPLEEFEKRAITNE